MKPSSLTFAEVGQEGVRLLCGQSLQHRFRLENIRWQADPFSINSGDYSFGGKKAVRRRHFETGQDLLIVRRQHVVPSRFVEPRQFDLRRLAQGIAFLEQRRDRDIGTTVFQQSDAEGFSIVCGTVLAKLLP